MREMNHFIINKNDFLNQDIEAFYHSDYFSGNWHKTGTIENMICTLKNDIKPFPEKVLQEATQKLKKILISNYEIGRASCRERV